MSTGIFYTTRAIGGREGQNLSRHLTILGRDNTQVDFLTGTTTDSSRKLIQQYSGLLPHNSQNFYGKWYEIAAKNMSDWHEVYEAIDITPLKNYDNLYLIGGVDLHRSNLGRTATRVGVFPRDRGQLKFESAGIHLTNILALLKAHNELGTPLHELAFDPNEMSLGLFHEDVAPKNDYNLYHGYAIPKYGARRLDSLQYYFQSIKTAPQNILFQEDTEKSVDFVFGYTVLKNSGREHYPEFITNLAHEFNVSHVYLKNEYTGENTHINNDRYLDEIAQAKYTFMLPSYDKHCFSVYRFIESIHHDCIPFVHPDCNITDIGASYNIDLSILVRTNPFPESERLEVLNLLKTAFLEFHEGFNQNT